MSESVHEEVLWLRIITPERIRLEASAHWVQVPTVDGMLGIWPLHAPLIDGVVPGNIEYEGEDGVHREWVEGGILHVRQGQVIILTGGLGIGSLPNIGALEAWEQSVQDIEAVMGELEAKSEKD